MIKVSELRREQLEQIVSKTLETIVNRELDMDESLCMIADILMKNGLLRISLEE